MSAIDPWKVQESAFPGAGSPCQKLIYLLNYAILAPSSHNTQPWLFKVSGPEVRLFADRRRALPVTDPHDRALIMACGAALYNLSLAIKRFGYEPVITTFPDFEDPDFMASVEIGRETEPTDDELALFRVIKKRRTNRNFYESTGVSPELLEEVVRAAEEEAACVSLVDSEEERAELIEMVVEGDRIQGLDERFRRELAAWIHPARKTTLDGMPAFSYLLPQLASYLGPYVVRNIEWANSRANYDRQLAEGSPVFIVLGTRQDNAVNWLNAGRALERIMLMAARHGMACSFLNQPVEVEILREAVARLFENPCYPQVILRLGYADSVPPSPRRPVEGVMI